MISVSPTERKDWVTSIASAGWYPIHERGVRFERGYLEVRECEGISESVSVEMKEIGTPIIFVAQTTLTFLSCLLFPSSATDIPPSDAKDIAGQRATTRMRV
jgi:hypothetical protein